MRTAEFVESYFDAWNHQDPEGVAGHLTTDGVFRDVPLNTQSSHDELVAYLTKFFARYPHRYELIGDILHSENTLAFQYRLYPLTANGPSVSYNGAEFMVLNGDAAATITDYYELPDQDHRTSVARMAAADAQQRKYAKSGLCDEQMRIYQQRLEDVMQKEQLYMRSDLTLPRLAKVVKCSVNHLSQVINSGFGMSFFDYLNKYRVQHAMAMLSEPDEQGNVILNIAFAVGFNSNSAFYAAFKKCVGQTPAQFRKRQLEKFH